MDSTKMGDKYNNLTDITAAELAADYLMCAYRLLIGVHPECGGFSAEVGNKYEEGDDVEVHIDLLTKIKENNGCTDTIKIH